jgi:hypothetical protein
MFELASLFLDPAAAAPGALGIVQVLFQIAFLSAPLVKGAIWMADGADLLTLLFDAVFVCSVVVPLLGALPDGFIILFSALGDDAQQQINVGMGTLAGSTNVSAARPALHAPHCPKVATSLPTARALTDRPQLLITAAVFLAVCCGAVDVSGRVLVGYARKPKLSGAAVGRPLFSGVVVAPAVLWTATIRLATTLPP